MKVKDIIGLCLEKMGKENFVENLSYSSEEQAMVDCLLRATNIVYREISTEYLPQYVTENVSVIDGVVDIAHLSQTILYPAKLTDTNGDKRKIKNLATSIETDFSGTGILTYAYLPDALSLSDNVDDLRLNVNIMSDGALSEYYFQDKVFDLANAYDTKFRSAISMLRYKGRNINIKQRRWGV